MRFDGNKAFPYPVLRPHCNDYIDVEFQSTVEFNISHDSINVTIAFNTSSDELKAQISSNRAQFVAVVSCRDTYFQRSISGGSANTVATLKSSMLKGEVQISCYIMAVQSIENFASPDINKEFDKKTFNFKAGDVLAQDETQAFYFDRDFFKPITSIFVLVKNSALSGAEWKVGLDENYVQIELSSEMKDVIDSARNDKKNQVILLNSIYQSAVVQALQRLKESQEDYKEKRWSIVLLGQLHNNGWDLASTEPYILAQRLMKQPLALLKAHIFKGE